MDINYICNQFNLNGKFYGYELIKSGNINQTFLVYYDYFGKINKYVLQKINSYVFKNPAVLMNNVVEVTNHIRRKSLKKKEKWFTLEFFPSKSGLSYYVDENSGYWRVCKYIDDSVSFNYPEKNCVEETGRAFGKFQRDLDDFEVNKLQITIENFHNTQKRYTDFIESVKNNFSNRKKSARKQIKFLIANKKIADYYSDLISFRQLPYRVTHNDTKISNVLFDCCTKKAIAVIDLDTVMPGIVAYDFGDCARSIASTALEDSADSENLDFDLDRYELFTKGFLSQVGLNLTDNEGKTLYMAPIVVTYELALRFLKDYLDGDLYFKCDYENHNLVRANNQIALLDKMQNKLGEIRKITEKYLYT